MKHANELLKDLVEQMEDKSQSEAHKRGMAETRRILGMEPRPEDKRELFKGAA